MNKKELLKVIRKTQKDIKDTMERLQYNINDLDEIRKSVLLSIPDEIVYDDKWIKDQELSNIIRKEPK